jgi:LysR family transcriptional activator of mexEF-oprN operon
VSYNGDLRGVVEDILGKTRDIRCSVSSFANLGALIDGTAMLATVPSLVATQIQAVRPHLRTKALPFVVPIAYFEMLWPAASDDDPPCRFARAQISRIAHTLAK